MDNTALEGIEAKLDAIISLLAAPVIEGKKIAETAPMLASLGLSSNLIARLCDTSPDVVRTAVRRKRSTKKTKRPKGK